MTGEELTSLARDVFGPMWKAEVARLVGKSWATIHNWATGKTPIGRAQAMLLRAVIEERRAFIAGVKVNGG